MAPRERDVTLQNEEKTFNAPVKSQLSEDDMWIDKLDLKAFREDIKELGKRLSSEQGPADVAHLHKMIMWSNICTFIGILGLGFSPLYFLPAMFLSIGTTTRWTMIAHHTCHGGYDNCEKTGRFNRFKFGVGSVWRRVLDWMDWMLPEAWNVEHNNLHHYHLGEQTDPDLVERNMAALREADLPLPFKYVGVFGVMLIWKWWYYSPNTYKELRIKEIRKKNPDAIRECKYPLHEPLTLTSFFTHNHLLPEWLSARDFFARVLIPYVFYRFFIVPLPAFIVAQLLELKSPEVFFMNAVMNLILADLIGNFHSFFIIGTNHAGDDLYTFATPCRAKTGTFYLRQVVSSVDFATGTDIVDFLHGWLNYQIEHHLFPDLSMLSYQKSQPIVMEICRRHKVPYIQESVFIRMQKTASIMMGTANMKVYPKDREYGDI